MVKRRERRVCAYVFNAQIKGKKAFVLQVKSQNTNAINCHHPYIGSCVRHALKLPWLHAFYLSPKWVSAKLATELNLSSICKKCL